MCKANINVGRTGSTAAHIAHSIGIYQSTDVNTAYLDDCVFFKAHTAGILIEMNQPPRLTKDTGHRA